MYIFGTLAVLGSVLVSCLGMPTQIYRNFKKKSCENLSLFWILLVNISYGLWVLYGVMKPDYYLILSESVGFLLSGVILFQFFVYRK